MSNVERTTAILHQVSLDSPPPYSETCQEGERPAPIGQDGQGRAYTLGSTSVTPTTVSRLPLAPETIPRPCAVEVAAEIADQRKLSDYKARGEVIARLIPLQTCWREIGVALELSDSRLDTIEANRANNLDRLIWMIFESEAKTVVEVYQRLETLAQHLPPESTVLKDLQDIRLAWSAGLTPLQQARQNNSTDLNQFPEVIQDPSLLKDQIPNALEALLQLPTDASLICALNGVSKWNLDKVIDEEFTLQNRVVGWLFEIPRAVTMNEFYQSLLVMALHRRSPEYLEVLEKIASSQPRPQPITTTSTPPPTVSTPVTTDPATEHLSDISQILDYKDIPLMMHFLSPVFGRGKSLVACLGPELSGYPLSIETYIFEGLVAWLQSAEWPHTLEYLRDSVKPICGDTAKKIEKQWDRTCFIPEGWQRNETPMNQKFTAEQWFKLKEVIIDECGGKWELIAIQLGVYPLKIMELLKTRMLVQNKMNAILEIASADGRSFGDLLRAIKSAAGAENGQFAGQLKQKFGRELY